MKTDYPNIFFSEDVDPHCVSTELLDCLNEESKLKPVHLDDDFEWLTMPNHLLAQVIHSAASVR